MPTSSAEILEMLRAKGRAGGRRRSTAYKDESLQLSAAVRAWNSEEWASLIRRHEDEPLAVAVMSDAWGTMVRDKQIVNMADEGLRVLRTGHFRHEYLLHRAVMRCRPRIGGQLMFQLIGMPRGLKLGKKAVNVFRAKEEFLPLLKQAGHRSISVTVYVEDGLLHTALEKLVGGYHERYCEQMAIESGPAAAQQLKDTDWPLFLKCTAHPCSNCIKTSARRLMPTDDVKDDLHIVSSAFLKGSSALFDHLDSFLMAKLEFARCDASIEDRRRYWQHYGVMNEESKSPEILEECVLLDLRWDPVLCKILVNSDLQNEPNIWQRMRAVCFFCLRWRVFSETRWCGATPSSKMLVRSWALGSEPLALLTMTDPNVSDAFLKGIKRASYDVKKLAVVLSFACTVPEAVQLRLLKDDRFLRIAAEARSTMNEKVIYLQDLPDMVWCRSARLIAATESPDVLRSESLQCSYIACGYMWHEFFEQLERPPLSMTQGNIAANVADLVAGPPPVDDEISRRVHQTATVWFSEPAAVRGLETATDLSGTVTLVEQAHSSGATTMRDSKQMGEQQMCSEAYLHTARRMWNERSDLEQEKVLLENIEDCYNPKAGKQYAFNMYLKENSGRFRQAVLDDGVTGRKIGPAIMTRARDEWGALLSERQRHEFHCRAHAENLKFESTKGERLLKHREDLVSIRGREQQRSDAMNRTNHLKDVDITEEDLARLADLFDEVVANWTNAKRDEKEASPAPIEEAEAEDLRRRSMVFDRQAPPRAWWI